MACGERLGDPDSVSGSSELEREAKFRLMAPSMYAFLVKTKNATVFTQLPDGMGNIKSGIRAEKRLQNAIMYLESDKRNVRRLALLLCRMESGNIDCYGDWG